MLASLLLFIVLFYTVQADVNKWPSVEEDHTKLQVVVPSSLTRKHGFPHRDALFGLPAYATGSLQAKLISADSTGCETFNNTYWEPPFALLLDRGDCHFVSKVRNAQLAGARAVLIGDDSCLCTDLECMKSTGDSMCERVLPYMADDDSGGDIAIPSMLIRKSDAKLMKDTMQETGNDLMVQFDWGVPAPDGRVEWTLWHSAWDDQSMVTLKEMEVIVRALGSRAHFTPRFVSYNGTKVGCHHESGKTNPCGNMCLNDGRYCLLDPSPYHDQNTGASGADVVKENLRRKCIWQLVAKEDPGVGLKWWKYVNTFGEQCSQDEKHFVDDTCARKVMEKVQIDYHQVAKCMQPLGRMRDVDNDMLTEELQEQAGLQLLRLPALYVDGVHARGRITGAAMLGMICAGYGIHDPPVVCQCATQAMAKVMDCVRAGSPEQMTEKDDKNQGYGFFAVFFMVTMIGAVMAMIGMAYYRRSQRQMRDQVRSILAEYMPLDDQDLDYDMESPGRLHPAVVASAKSPRGYLPTTNVDDFGSDF